MKISIITTVFNAQNTIAQTIESVLNQTHQDIEYIIIDAVSTDGTVEVIKQYEDKISVFISQPDTGIYAGLNKGIGLATGEVIGFVHADDFYPDNQVIADVVNEFSDEMQGVYGDLTYVNNAQKVIRYWQGRDFSTQLLKRGWMPAHPTLFLKKQVYEQYGVFDTNFKIAADYDFMLRILSAGIVVRYLPKTLYRMRIGGTSNKNIKNLIQKSKEDLHALKKNKIGGIWVLMVKIISKINQFKRTRLV